MELTRKNKAKSPQITVGGTPSIDLMPNAMVQKRNQRKLYVTWGTRLAGAVILIAIASGMMLAWQGVIAIQANGLDNESTMLNAQIEEKAEIRKLVDLESALQSYGKEVRATDLSWVYALEKIHSKMPAGSSVCGFDLVTGGVPEGAPQHGIGLAGEVEICGQFASAIPFLRDVESVEGVMSATAISTTWDQTLNAYRHLIRIHLDQSVYEQIRAAAAEAAESEDQTAEAPAPATQPETTDAAQQENTEGADGSTTGDEQNREATNP